MLLVCAAIGAHAFRVLPNLIDEPYGHAVPADATDCPKEFETAKKQECLGAYKTQLSEDGPTVCVLHKDVDCERESACRKMIAVRKDLQDRSCEFDHISEDNECQYVCNEQSGPASWASAFVNGLRRWLYKPLESLGNLRVQK